MPRKIIPHVIQQRSVVHLKEDATVHEAARLMRANDVGAVLIMSGPALKGILTVNDMTYRVVAEGLDPDSTPVSEVMTPEPDTIGSETTAIEALRLMQDGGYRHLPVVDGGDVRGIVSRRDFHGQEKARLNHETDLWERIA